MIEIHQELKEYNGKEYLSWRNPDGSPHFFYEENEYVHTPTRDGYLEVRLRQIESQINALWDAIKK